MKNNKQNYSAVFSRNCFIQTRSNLNNSKSSFYVKQLKNSSNKQYFIFSIHKDNKAKISIVVCFLCPQSSSIIYQQSLTRTSIELVCLSDIPFAQLYSLANWGTNPSFFINHWKYRIKKHTCEKKFLKTFKLQFKILSLKLCYS